MHTNNNLLEFDQKIKLLKSDKIQKDEIKEALKTLLAINKEYQKKLLIKEAEKTMNYYVGNNVYFRGIIEFSNYCIKDCYYCGIRKSNRNVKRYLMKYEDILECARFAASKGYGSLVLQSGEIQTKKFIDYVIKLITDIKKKTKKYQKNGLGITLSIGEQSKKVYEELFQAGAHRYLLRIETSSKSLYKKLHPDDEKHSFENRLNCLKYLKEIGYQVGTGVMIGLPEQTIEDLANDVIFFKEIDADMIGMGPYIIHRDTPMKWYEHEWALKKDLILETSLKMIAITRIFLKDVNIAATTALQVLHPRGRELGLKFGANVIMPIITPMELRKHYLLYEGKPCIDDNANKCKKCLEKRIKAIKRDIGWFEYGDSKHFFNRVNKLQLKEAKNAKINSR
ncbi:MAG: [FeFe] hydrogenase H-cluster radical SAM maturase HydE [Candidatus Anstonellales archaeon]